VSLQEVVERQVPDYAEEQSGASYPSVVRVLRFGWAQLSDFGLDLRPPKLARRMGKVIGRIGVQGVIEDPI